MPLPEVIEDVDLLRDDEPQLGTDSGVNPWCSNCMDELAGRGGVLCRDCYASIYITGVSIDWEMCIERALCQGSVRVQDWTAGHNAIPYERNGKPLDDRLCDTAGCPCHIWYSGFYC